MSEQKSPGNRVAQTHVYRLVRRIDSSSLDVFIEPIRGPKSHSTPCFAVETQTTTNLLSMISMDCALDLFIVLNRASPMEGPIRYPNPEAATLFRKDVLVNIQS